MTNDGSPCCICSWMCRMSWSTTPQHFSSTGYFSSNGKLHWWRWPPIRRRPSCQNGWKVFITECCRTSLLSSNAVSSRGKNFLCTYWNISLFARFCSAGSRGLLKVWYFHHIIQQTLCIVQFHLLVIVGWARSASHPSSGSCAAITLCWIMGLFFHHRHQQKWRLDSEATTFHPTATNWVPTVTSTCWDWIAWVNSYSGFSVYQNFMLEMI